MDDSTPIFIQLAGEIEGRILEGTYPEGTQVPSTNEFAAFMRINPATAGKGLNRLVDAGVLHKRRGIGMFVATGARERLMSARREAFGDQYLSPLIHEAARLGIDSDELIAMIGQRAAVAGK